MELWNQGLRQCEKEPEYTAHILLMSEAPSAPLYQQLGYKCQATVLPTFSRTWKQAEQHHPCCARRTADHTVLIHAFSVSCCLGLWKPVFEHRGLGSLACSPPRQQDPLACEMLQLQDVHPRLLQPAAANDSSLLHWVSATGFSTLHRHAGLTACRCTYCVWWWSSMWGGEKNPKNFLHDPFIVIVFFFLIVWQGAVTTITNTSRAARGGGGSFKNRKRIGEIGIPPALTAKRLICSSVSVRLFTVRELHGLTVHRKGTEQSTGKEQSSRQGKEQSRAQEENRKETEQSRAQKRNKAAQGKEESRAKEQSRERKGQERNRAEQSTGKSTGKEQSSTGKRRKQSTRKERNRAERAERRKGKEEQRKGKESRRKEQRGNRAAEENTEKRSQSFRFGWFLNLFGGGPGPGFKVHLA